LSDFGLLIVDKPVGPTSHQIVHIVRKGTGIRKVGHAGTLDPRASGVLVLCLGAATRLSEYLSSRDKRYQALVRFGEATNHLRLGWRRHTDGPELRLLWTPSSRR